MEKTQCLQQLYEIHYKIFKGEKSGYNVEIQLLKPIIHFSLRFCARMEYSKLQNFSKVQNKICRYYIFKFIKGKVFCKQSSLTYSGFPLCPFCTMELSYSRQLKYKLIYLQKSAHPQPPTPWTIKCLFMKFHPIFFMQGIPPPPELMCV